MANSHLTHPTPGQNDTAGGISSPGHNDYPQTASFILDLEDAIIADALAGSGVALSTIPKYLGSFIIQLTIYRAQNLHASGREDHQLMDYLEYAEDVDNFEAGRHPSGGLQVKLINQGVGSKGVDVAELMKQFNVAYEGLQTLEALQHYLLSLQRERYWDTLFIRECDVTTLGLDLLSALNCKNGMQRYIAIIKRKLQSLHVIKQKLKQLYDLEDEENCKKVYHDNVNKESWSQHEQGIKTRTQQFFQYVESLEHFQKKLEEFQTPHPKAGDKTAESLIQPTKDLLNAFYKTPRTQSFVMNTFIADDTQPPEERKVYAERARISRLLSHDMAEYSHSKLDSIVVNIHRAQYIHGDIFQTYEEEIDICKQAAEHAIEALVELQERSIAYCSLHKDGSNNHAGTHTEQQPQIKDFEACFKKVLTKLSLFIKSIYDMKHSDHATKANDDTTSKEAPETKTLYEIAWAEECMEAIKAINCLEAKSDAVCLDLLSHFLSTPHRVTPEQPQTSPSHRFDVAKSSLDGRYHDVKQNLVHIQDKKEVNHLESICNFAIAHRAHPPLAALLNASQVSMKLYLTTTILTPLFHYPHSTTPQLEKAPGLSNEHNQLIIKKLHLLLTELEGEEKIEIEKERSELMNMIKGEREQERKQQIIEQEREQRIAQEIEQQKRKQQEGEQEGEQGREQKMEQEREREERERQARERQARERQEREERESPETRLNARLKARVNLINSDLGLLKRFLEDYRQYMPGLQEKEREAIQKLLNEMSKAP